MQSPGERQDARWLRAQFASHISAEAPPTSPITPRQSGCCCIPLISPRMETRVRETTPRPSWAAIEQKAHPPAQPRCVVTENLFIRRAGVGRTKLGAPSLGRVSHPAMRPRKGHAVDRIKILAGIDHGWLADDKPTARRLHDHPSLTDGTKFIKIL